MELWIVWNTYSVELEFCIDYYYVDKTYELEFFEEFTMPSIQEVAGNNADIDYDDFLCWKQIRGISGQGEQIYFNAGETIFALNSRYTAIWKSEYTLNFYADEEKTGGSLASYQVHKGDSFIFPDWRDFDWDFNTENYEFAGWASFASGNIWNADFEIEWFDEYHTVDLEYYAVWNKKFNLNLYADSEMASEPLATYKVSENQYFDFPNISELNYQKEGYEFVGWSDGENLYYDGAAYIYIGECEEDDYNIYAVWKKHCTVTLYADETLAGEPLASYEVLEGKNFRFPDFIEFEYEKEAYEFAGWTNGEDNFEGESSVLIQDDTTFWVIWEEENYVELDGVYYILRTYGKLAETYDVFAEEDPEEECWEALIDSQTTICEILSEFRGRPVVIVSAKKGRWGNENLYEVNFASNSNIKIIPARAFQSCEKLEEITIPKSVVEIGGYAFMHCNLLKNVYFENASKLKIIGIEAFYGCEKLEEITIPKSVVEIKSSNYVYGSADGAFEGCTSLQTVIFENGINLKKLDHSIFSYCTSLTNIIIPETVEYIGHGAFKECNLRGITIPSNVEYIGESAFEGCTNLNRVVFEEGCKVTEIYYKTFAACSNLNSVSLHEGLKRIHSRAFAACSSASFALFTAS